MDDVALLVEKHRIVEAITDLFVGTDRRDWASVRACFTPQVLFDMSSLGGGAPGTVPAAEIVAGWERGLAPLRAVHHQVGNFQVRVEPGGGAAEASCHGIASHYLPNPSGRNTRVFVGTYDLGLVKEGPRWLVARFRFDLKYVDGNLELERSR